MSTTAEALEVSWRYTMRLVPFCSLTLCQFQPAAEDLHSRGRQLCRKTIYRKAQSRWALKAIKRTVEMYSCSCTPKVKRYTKSCHWKNTCASRVVQRLMDAPMSWMICRRGWAFTRQCLLPQDRRERLNIMLQEQQLKHESDRKVEMLEQFQHRQLMLLCLPRANSILQHSSSLENSKLQRSKVAWRKPGEASQLEHFNKFHDIWEDGQQVTMLRRFLDVYGPEQPEKWVPIYLFI